MDDNGPKKRPRGEAARALKPLFAGRRLPDYGRPPSFPDPRVRLRKGLYGAIVAMPTDVRDMVWATFLGPDAMSIRDSSDERGWFTGLIMTKTTDMDSGLGRLLALLLRDEDIYARFFKLWNPDFDIDIRGRTLFWLACTAASSTTTFDDFDIEEDVQQCSGDKRKRCGSFGAPSADWLVVINKLVKLGANPLNDGGRPLLAERLHPDVFSIVLQALQRIKGTNKFERRHCVSGQTPLVAQIDYGNLWATRALLEAGADPNYPAVQVVGFSGSDSDSSEGSLPPVVVKTTPMVANVRAVPFQFEGTDYIKAARIAELLLKRNADPAGINEIILGSNGHGFRVPSLLRLLVKAGARLFSPRHRPLVEMAVNYDEWECAEILLEGMIGPNISRDAQLILDNACLTCTFPGLVGMIVAGKHRLVDLALTAAQMRNPLRSKMIVCALGGSIPAAMRCGDDKTAARLFRVLWKYDGFRDQHVDEVVRIALVREFLALLNHRMPETFASAATVARLPSPEETARDVQISGSFEGTAAIALVELMRTLGRFPIPRRGADESTVAVVPATAASKALGWILVHLVFEPGSAPGGINRGSEAPSIEAAWRQMFHTPFRCGLGPPLSVLCTANNVAATWSPLREALRVTLARDLIAKDFVDPKVVRELPQLPDELWDHIARIAYVLELCSFGE